MIFLYFLDGIMTKISFINDEESCRILISVGLVSSSMNCANFVLNLFSRRICII